MELIYPDWDALRADGSLIVDAPSRKTAIYSNDDGHVVILSMEDGITHSSVLTPDEVPHAMKALLICGAKATEREMEIEADYGAFLAIEKARGV
jgi:hypothetical protein